MRWPNGLSAPEDLGFMGSGQYSAAYGINDLGEVVGVADNGSATHGFLWRNGTYTDLGSLAGSGGASVAYVINNSTVIAGSSNGGYLSFVWQNGVMTQLPFPPGIASSSVFDINNVGDIVGASATFFQEHAILWRDGEAIDLGTWPGGTRSFAWGSTTPERSWARVMFLGRILACADVDGGRRSGQHDPGGNAEGHADQDPCRWQRFGEGEFHGSRQWTLELYFKLGRRELDHGRRFDRRKNIRDQPARLHPARAFSARVSR